MPQSSNSNDPINKGLRARLLLSSLCIAVVVSAVSMIVAYRMSVDMGQTYELRSLKSHADSILFQLKREREPASIEQMLQDTIKVRENLSESGLSPLMIDVNNRTYYSPGVDPSLFVLIKASDEYSPNSDGLVEIDGNQKMWIQRSLDQDGIELILVCDPGYLDKTLGYIAKRLSVTAFLTFWIAVWGALLLSGQIIRRIEVHNKMLAQVADNMVHLAMHDSLTKLPNRTHLTKKVENYLKQNSSGEDHLEGRRLAALMMIDLDRFKEVNDTLGRAVGDELLIALSSRLRTELDDAIFLARIGGDEFVVWCEDIEEEAALAIADQIRECCRRSVMVNDMYLGLEASIGIAVYPQHGEDVPTLIKKADASMYKAKKNRLGVKLYNDQDATQSVLNIRLNHDFHFALKESQIELFYQTKINLKDNSVVGVEALSRWRHPELGMIQPNDFIPLVEQGGRVNEFSRYVINKAVNQIRLWLDQGLDINIAVNLSPYNLADPELARYVQEALERYQVPAQMLELELTETATMIDIETTRQAFKALKALGVLLSIDDYGTGMSSLAYIKELDVDFIKLDRSFVSNMIIDVSDRVIVESTIEMILKLGRKVVAEGIETKELAEQLCAMNCSYGQGYFFSRPTSADLLTPLLLDSSVGLQPV